MSDGMTRPATLQLERVLYCRHVIDQPNGALIELKAHECRSHPLEERGHMEYDRIPLSYRLSRRSLDPISDLARSGARNDLLLWNRAGSPTGWNTISAKMAVATPLKTRATGR